MAKRGDIPHHRNGAVLVFRKSEIDSWASQRLLALHPESLSEFHKASTATDKFFPNGEAIVPRLFRPAWIIPELHARTKPSVLREMTTLADSTGLVIDANDLLEALEAREKMASTALGGGVALLHPPHQQPYRFDDTFIVLARTLSPIPFGSPDGQATDLFFLICTQDKHAHLHILSRVCMMCHNTSLLLDLREAKDRQEMYDALLQAEQDVIAIRQKTQRR